MERYLFPGYARRASIFLLALAVALAAVLFAPVAFAQDGTGGDADSTEEAQPGNQENVAQAQGVRWQATGEYRGCGASRQQKWAQYNPPWDGGTKYQWLSAAEALRWGTWSATGTTDRVRFSLYADTGSFRGSGASREKQQSSTRSWRAQEKRTSHCNTSEYRMVPQSITVYRWVPWPDWSDTGQTSGCGPDKQKQQVKGSETRWVRAPEPLQWVNDWSATGTTDRVSYSLYADTGSFRGSGASREKQQSSTRSWRAQEKRTSHCNTSEYRMVPQSITVYRWVPWPDWSDTGQTSGCGPDKQKQQVKGSETRWVRAPEPLRWGAWSATGEEYNVRYSLYTDTGNFRGSGSTREKERQSTRSWRAQEKSTSHCGTTKYRYTSPIVIVTQWVPWPDWEDSGPTLGCGPDRTKHQFKGSETRWVPAPEALRWNDWAWSGEIRNRSQTSWTSTGKTRGSGATLEREEQITRSWQDRKKRTSHCNTNEYGEWETRSVTNTRWTYVTPPEEWTDRGKTRGCGPDREKEQFKGSETRWVSDPEDLRWNDWDWSGEIRNRSQTSWTDTSKTRGSGASLKKEQERTRTWEDRKKRTSHCNTNEYGEWETRSVTDTRWVDPDDTAPSFGSGASRSTISDITATIGQAITSVTLPVATGGDAPLTYSLSPALPNGLDFNASTRVLSGTPLAAAGATTYTYMVTDSDTTNPDSDSLNFSIKVLGPPPAPTGLNPVVGETCNDNDRVSVVLHWDAVTGASRYEAKVTGPGGGALAIEGPGGGLGGPDQPTTHKTFRDLQPRTMYSFQVKTHGDGETYSTGWGEWSTAVNALTRSCDDITVTIDDVDEWVDKGKIVVLSFTKEENVGSERLAGPPAIKWERKRPGPDEEWEPISGNLSIAANNGGEKGAYTYQVSYTVGNYGGTSDPVTIYWTEDFRGIKRNPVIDACPFGLVTWDAKDPKQTSGVWNDTDILLGTPDPVLVGEIAGLKLKNIPVIASNLLGTNQIWTRLVDNLACVKVKFTTKTDGSKKVYVHGTLNVYADRLPSESGTVNAATVSALEGLSDGTEGFRQLIALYTDRSAVRLPVTTDPFICKYCKGGFIETDPITVNLKYLKKWEAEALTTHQADDQGVDEIHPQTKDYERQPFRDIPRSCQADITSIALSVAAAPNPRGAAGVLLYHVLDVGAGAVGYCERIYGTLLKAELKADGVSETLASSVVDKLIQKIAGYIVLPNTAPSEK